MKSLVTIKVSNRTFRYYNNMIKVLKGLVGGYMLVVGAILRLSHPILCGALGAMIVASFI